jgi:hypothetical protein
MRAATAIASLCPSWWLAGDRPGTRILNRSSDGAGAVGPPRRMDHEPGQIVKLHTGLGRLANDGALPTIGLLRRRVPALPLAGRPDSIIPSC